MKQLCLPSFSQKKMKLWKVWITCSWFLKSNHMRIKIPKVKVLLFITVTHFCGEIFFLVYWSLLKSHWLLYQGRGDIFSKIFNLPSPENLISDKHKEGWKHKGKSVTKGCVGALLSYINLMDTKRKNAFRRVTTVSLLTQVQYHQFFDLEKDSYCSCSPYNKPSKCCSSNFSLI